jgi:hypothetical protein
MTKMTIAKAKLVIADLAKQDRANDDRRSAAEQIEGWYRSAGQAGDEGVVAAIDALGTDRAVSLYAKAAKSLAGRVAS